MHVKDALVWGGTIDVKACGGGRGRSWWFERRERAFLDHEEAALALSRAREGAPVRAWGIYATNRHNVGVISIHTCLGHRFSHVYVFLDRLVPHLAAVPSLCLASDFSTSRRAGKLSA